LISDASFSPHVLTFELRGPVSPVIYSIGRQKLQHRNIY
jgi:hypothetical protein